MTVEKSTQVIVGSVLEMSVELNLPFNREVEAQSE